MCGLGAVRQRDLVVSTLVLSVRWTNDTPLSATGLTRRRIDPAAGSRWLDDG
jgi:hypothetical protein